MSDTISRQAAIDAIESAFDRETILNRFVRKIAISAVRLLPSAQPEPQWIPCSERLPEVGESVLICDAYGDICIGHRTRSGYYFPDFCEDKIKDVRAWAELPEPFNGVTE